jgi:hypothetical protein
VRSILHRVAVLHEMTDASRVARLRARILTEAAVNECTRAAELRDEAAHTREVIREFLRHTLQE